MNETKTTQNGENEMTNQNEGRNGIANEDANLTSEDMDRILAEEAKARNEIHETENLTEKEIKALKVIIHGSHSNLEDDCTAVWAQPSDLIEQGYTKHEAAGLWSSLLEKGSLDLYEERDKQDGGDLFTVMTGHLPIWKQEYITKEDRNF